ncbi:hypothetical protein MY11210_007748 [Beauveria gryllotalpidicola]
MSQASHSTGTRSAGLHHGSLQQRLSTLSTLAMAFAILNTWIALAGSIGLILPSGGSVAFVYGFLLCLVCSFCVVASLGELAAIWPTAGGQYHYVFALCAEKWRKPVVSRALYWSILGVVVTSIVLLAKSAKTDAEYVFTKFKNETNWPDGVAWILGLVQSALSLTGFDVVLHMTEEMPNPRRDAPRALIYTIAVGGLTSFLFILVILFCLTDPTSVLTAPGNMPIVAMVLRATQSRAAACIISLMISVCFINGSSASITSVSRLLFAMARDRGIIFHDFFAYITPRLDVPIRSILLCYGFNVCFGLLYLGPSVAFSAYVASLVILLNFSYAAPTIIVLIRGRQLLNAARSTKEFRLPRSLGIFVNYVSVLFLTVTSIKTVDYVCVVLGIFAVIVSLFWLKCRSTFLGPNLDMIAGHDRDAGSLQLRADEEVGSVAPPRTTLQWACLLQPKICAASGKLRYQLQTTSYGHQFIMFATLPDFTPRDSHSLWYTSSRAPILGGLPDGPEGGGDAAYNHHPHAPNGPNGPHQRQRGHIIERTALARLAADEAYMQRRRSGIQNYGSTWLRPPGLPKTLHQMREEKREQEEHQEAMRREQLAQELADAEAEAEAEAEAAGGGEDAMDDVQLDGAQDLDEEIPDADDEFALGGGSDSEEEEDEDEEENVADVSAAEEALREERRNDLMAARMRMTDDAFREALVRGDPDGDDMYGGGDEELDAFGQGHMLDEEDFAPSSLLNDGDVDLGMDANLDDDIPEAEEEEYDAGYEHTDSDAALSSDDKHHHDRESSEEEEEDFGFAPRAAPLRPPQSPTLRGQPQRRSNAGATPRGPRSSMDLSAFLSQDESSFMDSSPASGRRNMRS